MIDVGDRIQISRDGKLTALARPDGESYSISMLQTGAPLATARHLCALVEVAKAGMKAGPH